MNYFVYWSDDYPDNGGVGIEPFPSLDEALRFIESRLVKNKVAIDCYTLIKGVEMELGVAQYATTVKVK